MIGFSMGGRGIRSPSVPKKSQNERGEKVAGRGVYDSKRRERVADLHSERKIKEEKEQKAKAPVFSPGRRGGRPREKKGRRERGDKAFSLLGEGKRGGNKRNIR